MSKRNLMIPTSVRRLTDANIISDILPLGIAKDDHLVLMSMHFHGLSANCGEVKLHEIFYGFL